jgi:hypothetical protein
VCKQPFKYVTIEPDEDSLGHVLYRQWSKKHRQEFDPRSVRAIQRLESAAICNFAGAAAAGLLVNQDFEWSCASNDRNIAIDMIELIESESDALSAYCQLLELRARNLVRGHRDEVKQVAQELLQQTRLSFKSVRQIVYPNIKSVRIAGPMPSDEQLRELWRRDGAGK